MPQLPTRLTAIALMLCTAAAPCLAASSAASSASDSSATSVGSSSGSIQKSSTSSSTPTPVAAGDYRVIDVAAVPEQPGSVRMTLRPEADAGSELALVLPQAALDRSQLAPGQLVTARARPYGLEFANGATRQAFFLVLDDDWYRELQTKPVVL